MTIGMTQVEDVKENEENKKKKNLKKKKEEKGKMPDFSRQGTLI